MIRQLLLYLLRKRLHYRYMELQKLFPSAFPIGDESEFHVWLHHVPGCHGSTWFKHRGDTFENMINCECHKGLARWAG